MKVLVTGGSGFIGSHLLTALVAHGHETYNLSRNPPAAPASGVTTVLGDLRQIEGVELPTVDAIVHLAQSNIRFPEGADDLMTINCVSAVRLALAGIRQGVGKFIYGSTGNVYGLSPTAVAETALLQGGSFYAESKIAAERLLGELKQKISLDILRIFSPYGPGQQTFRLIPDLVRRVQEGRTVSIRANGMPILSPIYVDDAVQAILQRIQSSDHLTVNLAGDEMLSIETMARNVAELLGKEALFEPIVDEMTGGIAGINGRLHQLLGRSPLHGLRDCSATSNRYPSDWTI